MMKKLLYDVDENKLYIKTYKQKTFQKFIILKEHGKSYVGENNEESNVEMLADEIYLADKESTLLFTHFFDSDPAENNGSFLGSDVFNSDMIRAYRGKVTKVATSNNVIIYNLAAHTVRKFPKIYAVESKLKNRSMPKEVIMNFFGAKTLESNTRTTHTKEGYRTFASFLNSSGDAIIENSQTTGVWVEYENNYTMRRMRNKLFSTMHPSTIKARVNNVTVYMSPDTFSQELANPNVNVDLSSVVMEVEEVINASVPTDLTWGNTPEPTITFSNSTGTVNVQGGAGGNTLI